MNSEELERLINEAVKDADLRPENIPSIDLYLDQILSLASDKVKEGSKYFQDRVLTNTMVNNYSKDGLISPIQGKKYSKEQFVQMLLVYGLKNTLSIGEIRRILQNIYDKPDYSKEALLECYGRFLDTKEYQRENAWPMIKWYLQGVGLNPEENEQDFFMTVLGLASISSYLKNIVQVLVENHYPDLNQEKVRKEKERQEEAKRIKEEKKKTEKSKKEVNKSSPKEESEEKE